MSSTRRPTSRRAKSGGQRKAQIGPALLDAASRSAGEHRYQAAADGFDLGQLGHGGKLARLRGLPLWFRAMSDPADHTRASELPPSADEATTHFGFRTVRQAEKRSLVGAVFNSVASRYDLMNDLMSGGVHRLWKSAMIDWLNPRPEQLLLDVGGGTGDIAFRFLERGGGGAVVVDINREMLAVGRDRAIDRGQLRGLDWVCGDAERLPVADASVDAYTIAFGIRNVTRIDAGAARGAARAQAGRPLSLPRVQPRFPAGPRSPLRRLLVPRAAGCWAASSPATPTPTAISPRASAGFRRRSDSRDMIGAAGLDLVSWRNLSGGIVALHSAWRT